MNAAWSIAVSLRDLGSTAASSALVSAPSSSVLSNRCASGHEPRSGSKPSTLTSVCCAALSCDSPSVAACDGLGGGAVAAPSARMRARRDRAGSNMRAWEAGARAATARRSASTARWAVTRFHPCSAGGWLDGWPISSSVRRPLRHHAASRVGSQARLMRSCDRALVRRAPALVCSRSAPRVIALASRGGAQPARLHAAECSEQDRRRQPGTVH